MQYHSFEGEGLSPNAGVIRSPAPDRDERCSLPPARGGDPTCVLWAELANASVPARGGDAAVPRAPAYHNWFLPRTRG
jgi:hypothetical protein